MKGVLSWVGLIFLGGLFIAAIGAVLMAVGIEESVAYGIPNFVMGGFTFWYAKREGWW